ncbi:DUF3006 family protein [Virgibacillus byunsanensis]|uniref:DUF3006 family protein n=1 Tax=Virgibacillus byunsanensis TaxID=570945 RepID=A0ABW3LIG9_9BACI
MNRIIHFLGTGLVLLGVVVILHFDIDAHVSSNEKDTFTTKGVLDRFEDDQAVILMEEKKEELIVAKKTLPAGSKLSTWFHIKWKHDKYMISSIDYKKTREEASKLRELRKILR